MDSAARSWYRNEGYVIASHSILWDAITYPCLRYLLLATKSLYDCWSSPQQIIMFSAAIFRVSYERWSMLLNDTSEKLYMMVYFNCTQDGTQHCPITGTIFLSFMTKHGLNQCGFNVKDIMCFLTETLLSHQYAMQKTDPEVHWSCVSEQF